MEGMAMIMMRGMDTVGMVVDMEEDRAPYFKSIGMEFWTVLNPIENVS